MLLFSILELEPKLLPGLIYYDKILFVKVIAQFFLSAFKVSERG